MNRYDALHHIISPTLRFYRPGLYNKSVLNSCPIHNFKCHIGNDGYLHKDDVIRSLLKKNVLALDNLGYKTRSQRDAEFLMAYNALYPKEDNELQAALANIGL